MIEEHAFPEPLKFLRLAPSALFQIFKHAYFYNSHRYQPHRKLPSS